MTVHADLEFEIALALREVRLYWHRGKDPLTMDDKRRLAAMILDRLGRARVRLERLPVPPQGTGTGRFMVTPTRQGDGTE